MPTATRAVAVWLVSVTAVLSADAAAQVMQPGPALWRIERAELAATRTPQRPNSAAEWRAIDLPDSWAGSLQEGRGWMWYRMTVTLPAAPKAPYAVYVPNRRSFTMELYANGTLFGSDRQSGASAGAWYWPVFFVIPPAFLQAGENRLEVAMFGDARLGHGLGRVTFGEAGAVRPFFLRQNVIQTQLQYAQMVTLAVLGLFGLALWLARRREALALWFALGAFTWSGAFAVHVATLGIELGPWRQLLLFVMWTAPPVFTAAACLRLASRRIWVAEAALWGSFFFAAAWILLGKGPAPNPVIWSFWPPAYTFLPLLAAGWLLATQRRSLSWSLYVFAAAAILAALLPLHDWLRTEAILDLDRPSLRHLQTVDLILGLGALMLERYLKATREMEHMNVELERRVAEKSREIENAARRMQAIREEQTLARERERILAEMHDGLGASLVTLTHIAQNEAVSREELARRATDALQELRIAIDSLEFYGDDLATVLGHLRQRIERSTEAAGVRLQWEVGDLPPLEHLTPSAVLNVQRIVLEAVTNALRHASARTVRVKAAQESDAIRITVEDDGRGFDPELGALGYGLRNMRRRVERLGATLDIRSAPGRGASVAIEIRRPALPKLEAEPIPIPAT